MTSTTKLGSLIVASFAASVAFGQEKLPANLKWESNNSDPVYASPEAKRGGVLNDFMRSFPLTMRTMGPDANDSFANYRGRLDLGLVGRHPNTLNVMPILANEWAYGPDKKTMYYRINPKAKWSDGKPVVADDFVFALETWRSKDINDPYYNQVAEEDFDKVIKFDDRTLGVRIKVAKPELDLQANLAPMPKHYFGKIGPDFVQKYNWDSKVPVTGPYVIDKVEKGKLVSFKRIKDWWGNDERFFKNRFNVDELRLKVMRDDEIAFESFKKGDLDHFWVTRPVSWHDKCKGEIWDKGYVEKIWAYNDSPQGVAGIVLNVEAPIFQDVNVRQAFGHSMNFELVIQKLIYGDYERMNTMFDGYGAYTNSSIRARKYDIAKVKELMEKSGWKRGSNGIYEKGGKTFTVRLTVGSDPQIVKRIEVLKEEAKKAGLDLQIQAIDNAAAFKTAREKKHEAFYTQMGAGLRPEPWQYLHSQFAKPQTNNFFQIKDPELDKLTDSYKDSTEVKERQELARKIAQRVHDLGLLVPSFKVPFDRSTHWRWWRFPTPPSTKIAEQDIFEAFDAGVGGLFWFDEAKHKETKEAMKSGKAFKPVVLVDKTFKQAD